MDELDEVTDEAHNRETDSNSLRDLEELYITMLRAIHVRVDRINRPLCDGLVHLVRNYQGIALDPVLFDVLWE